VVGEISSEELSNTMTPRTTDCPDAVRIGRFNKAIQFFDAGVFTEDDLPDAAVNSFVHAGIAAADAICCSRLGKHARGENHEEAVALLRQADSDAAKHLSILLGMKTKVAYTHRSSSTEDRKRARRAAEALLEAARVHAPPEKKPHQE
jgi:hypothetical protein